MENAVLVASNLYALRAILAWPAGSIERILTICAACASIAYHLIDRTHGARGLIEEPRFARLILLVDRTFAIALALAWLSWPIPWATLRHAASTLLLLILSEMPAPPPIPATAWYACWHGVWHVAAFHWVFDAAVEAR